MPKPVSVPRAFWTGFLEGDDPDDDGHAVYDNQLLDEAYDLGAGIRYSIGCAFRSSKKFLSLWLAQ